MATERTTCRVCDERLTPLWELGEFQLCGFFPEPEESVPKEPMGLSYCPTCFLVQMHYDYAEEQFGSNYGYRSGLNKQMADHLAGLAQWAQDKKPLLGDSLVVDIGGNDGTLLRSITSPCRKTLIDPTAGKWRQEADVTVIPEKFRRGQIERADLIFSVAMFYDLPEPVQFATDVARSLKEDGLWILEQSYLPSMVSRNAFDTICHEHLEYYSLSSLDAIMYRAGLRIVHSDVNDANGGSIRIAVAHRRAKWIASIPQWKSDMYFNENLIDQFSAMRERVDRNRDRLFELLYAYETVHGLGASTKGNTLLQYYGIGPETVQCVVDVNPEKSGKVTATGIPIRLEADRPDAHLVLPWHFHESIRRRYKGRLIFPLPAAAISVG